MKESSDKMQDKDKVNDLVTMIDQLMAQGQKHINVKVHESGDVDIVDKVSVRRIDGCEEGDTACRIPTMFYEDNETSE